jgi:Ca-activated chloride channel family protein
MDFQHPWYLLLFALIPILIGWYRTSGRNKEGTLRISSSTFISEEFRIIGKRKHRLLQSLYLMVLSLVILGLARPRLIDNLQETSFSVIDMLLVLDISSSMLADDFPPNRLEAVKKTASDFIEGRKEDRIGILVFAGESFIQCPLTVDKKVLQSLIK